MTRAWIVGQGPPPRNGDWRTIAIMVGAGAGLVWLLVRARLI